MPAESRSRLRLLRMGGIPWSLPLPCAQRRAAAAAVPVSPRTECFDQMIYIEQQEESKLQIISILREESLPRIISGIYDPNVILQNMSEQYICFDRKYSIKRERNAVDLFDQSDSKGQMTFIVVSSRFGCTKQ